MVDVIYTDAMGREQGTLAWCEGDFLIGDYNNFELKVPPLDGLVEGCYLMIEGLEYGGVIDGIEIDTEEKYMTVSGRTWHGIMASSIVCPPSGSSHLTVSGDANTIIANLIERQGLGFCLAAPTQASGITVSNYSFERYTDMYSAIRNMLMSVAARCSIAYDGRIRRAVVSAVERKSDTIDSDKAGFVVSSKRPVNHLIGLGQGEGASRAVVHAYADAKGNVGTTQKLFGIAENTRKYENVNVDSTRLLEETLDKLKEYQEGLLSCQMKDTVDSAYNIDDLVSATYAKRNITVSSRITRKQAVIDGVQMLFKTTSTPIG